MGRDQLSVACTTLCVSALLVISNARINYDLPDLVTDSLGNAEIPLEFLIEPPQSIEFLNTVGVKVPCVARGVPSPQTYWTMANSSVPLSEITGLRHSSGDGALIFPPFKAEELRPSVHDTVYRCVASSTKGKLSSRFMSVKAVLFQQYDVSAHDGFTTKGGAAVLSCRVVPESMANMARVVGWLRDDGVLITASYTAKDRKYMVLPTGELFVTEVSERDAEHSFKCQLQDAATNVTRLHSRPARIILQSMRKSEAPRIMHYAKEVVVRTGAEAWLMCVAKGEPPPQYHWLRQSGVAVAIRHAHQTHMGILRLRNVRSDDAGRYSCVVNNTYGEDRVFVNLVVKGAPQAVIHPRYQRVPLGSAVKFVCNATGARDVRWIKDLEPVVPSVFDKVQLFSPTVLTLGSVKSGQEGSYQCLVSNGKESAQASAFLQLKVTKPELLITFDVSKVHQGTFVSLKCAARGHPMPRVTWLFDENPVPHSSRRVLRGDFVTEDHVVHSFVNITAANITDGGEYVCIADNDAGTATHSAQLHIYGSPLGLPLRNVTVLAGDTLALPCPVKGFPLSSFSWFKGLYTNRTIVDGQRYRINRHGKLTIHDVSRKADSGVLTCSASSTEGRAAEGSVRIHVAVPPVINPFSFPTTVREGDRSTIQCFVSAGDRPMTIRWLKDGQPLEDVVRLVVNPTKMNEFVHVLYFEDITEEHNGTYTCVASNAFASTNYSADMLVQVSPRWTKSPEDVSTLRGQTARFDCVSSGYPTPVIRWKMPSVRQNDGLITIRSNAKQQVLENGSLVIQNAEPSDSGTYLCQASNGVGPDITQEAKLRVSVPATCLTTSTAITVQKGEKVHMRCEAFGDRPITLTWYKERALLDVDANSLYTVAEHQHEGGATSQLYIQNAQRNDSGSFACKAANDFGKDEMHIKLTVQEPPDAPQDVHVQHLTSRSAIIRWSVPFDGHSTLTQFDVKVRSSRDGNIRVLPIPGTQVELTLDNLTPNTPYEVEVLAVNAVGTGLPSQALSFSTETEAPASKPRDIKIFPSSPTVLRISWKPPLDEAEIIGYYVGYKPERDSGESFVYKTVESRSSGEDDVFQECEIKGLKSNSRYIVIVQAYNSKGPGPSSDPVHGETLPADLSQVFWLDANATSYNEITVVWNDALEKPRDGYKLHVRGNGSHEWETHRVSSSSHKHTLSGLRCGTRYELYLESVTEKRPRPRTTAITTVSTRGSAPIVPVSSHLFFLPHSRSIDLSTILDGGCPITQYVVKYRTAEEMEWHSIAHEDILLTRVVSIPNFDEGRTYKVLLGAANSAGYSEAVYDIVSVIPGFPESGSATQQDLHRRLAVATSVVCSVVVLVVVIVAVCVEVTRRRRRLNGALPDAMSDTYAEPHSMKTAVKCTVDAEDLSMETWSEAKQTCNGTARRLVEDGGSIYGPCPYGTTGIPLGARMCSASRPGTLSRRCRDSDLYDMPIPPYAKVHRDMMQNMPAYLNESCL